MNEIYAEKTKLPNTPISKEFRKQKMEATKWQCRHLRGVTIVPQFDYYNDELVNVSYCNLCNMPID
uniref:Uncharacterized protein n=1 Tax=viral metagenome TaxID=1070528 RepID=A0A6M3XWT4_9ZZZZ